MFCILYKNNKKNNERERERWKIPHYFLGVDAGSTVRVT